MPEYVRVKDNETTHEYSVTAERYDAEPDLYTKLDRPAADAAGIPFPPKYRTTVKAPRQVAPQPPELPR